MDLHLIWLKNYVLLNSIYILSFLPKILKPKNRYVYDELYHKRFLIIPYEYVSFEFSGYAREEIFGIHYEKPVELFTSLSQHF